MMTESSKITIEVSENEEVPLEFSDIVIDIRIELTEAPIDLHLHTYEGEDYIFAKPDRQLELPRNCVIFIRYGGFEALLDYKEENVQVCMTGKLSHCMHVYFIQDEKMIELVLKRGPVWKVYLYRVVLPKDILA